MTFNFAQPKFTQFSTTKNGFEQSNKLITI